MVTEITKIVPKSNNSWLVHIKHNNNNYRLITTNSNAINKLNGESDENLINKFLWTCRRQIEERESKNY